MTALRVTSTHDPRLTRTARSWAGAEHRARTVALLVGQATIEQRERSGEWSAVERFQRDGWRVNRVEGRR